MALPAEGAGAVPDVNGPGQREVGDVDKKRIYEILEVAAPNDLFARGVEVALVALIVLNVTAVILETVPELSAAYARVFLVIEFVTVALFLTEYAARLWVAPLQPALSRLPPWRARASYALHPFPIIDLIAILPSVVAILIGSEDLGFVVIFRLIRFLKLARYSPGMRSLAAAIVSERRAIMASGVIMLGLVIATATMMHALEGTIQPDKFGSIPLAMYWAVTTLTTVGYGDVVPVTAAGRLLAGITMVTGFTMFALPVGIIATAFAREIRQRDFVVTWSMVARVPLFSGLGGPDIAEVMRLLRAQTVEAGAVVTYAGEPATSMFFVVAGEVELDLPDGKRVLGDGSFFGEIAVLRRSHRSADVVALSRTRLLVLDVDDVHHLMHRRPEIRTRIREMAAQTGSGEPVTPQGDIAATELGRVLPLDRA